MFLYLCLLFIHVCFFLKQVKRTRSRGGDSIPEGHAVRRTTSKAGDVRKNIKHKTNETQNFLFLNKNLDPTTNRS